MTPLAFLGEYLGSARDYVHCTVDEVETGTRKGRGSSRTERERVSGEYCVGKAGELQAQLAVDLGSIARGQRTLHKGQGEESRAGLIEPVRRRHAVREATANCMCFFQEHLQPLCMISPLLTGSRAGAFFVLDDQCPVDHVQGRWTRHGPRRKKQAKKYMYHACIVLCCLMSCRRHLGHPRIGDERKRGGRKKRERMAGRRE